MKKLKINALYYLTIETCITVNDHLTNLAHFTPIHFIVENYLIFFVFLLKNIAHTQLGIVFAYRDW